MGIEGMPENGPASLSCRYMRKPFLSFELFTTGSVLVKTILEDTKPAAIAGFVSHFVLLYRNHLVCIF